MAIKLQFLGATRNVTGSSFLLEVGDSRILVDCGLYQERELRYRNWRPFPVDPRSVDVVLLTHAHLDHCGLLPKLAREGFAGKIICTAPTEEIAKIVLLDSAHIQEEDATHKKKRHKKERRKGAYPEVPLYTQEDVKRVFPLFESVVYEKPITINGQISVSFHDAGHILGSSMIKVKISRHNNPERTIVLSGDIGRWNKPIVRDPTLFEEADYIVVESTYGDRHHEDSSDITNRLSDVIAHTEQKGGNVVIPSFAIERAQELLYHLNELLREDRIPHLVTFVDSPMAINVTEVFKHHPQYFDAEMLGLVTSGNSPFYFSTLRLTRSTEESKAINHIRGSSIIIAGSGMCTGGRIKHHLVNNISRPESTILFVGYQAKGTLGRKIVKGAKTIRIHGVMHSVKANIVQIDGFSAHADQGELLGWLSGLKSPTRRVFVVHGEDESSSTFARLVREKYGWQVSIPQYKERVVLN